MSVVPSGAHFAGRLSRRNGIGRGRLRGLTLQFGTGSRRVCASTRRRATSCGPERSTVFVSEAWRPDASGVFVAVWTGRSSGFVRKYTPAGDELWIRPVDTGEVCACDATQAALAADATGVYVASGVVSKLDQSGNTMWKRQLSPAADGTNFELRRWKPRLRHWTRRALYVAGGTQRALPGQCKAGYGDVFVRKYSIADGTEQWTCQFGTRGYDFLGGIAVDASGVYVGGGIRGGPAHGNIFLAKLGKTRAPVVSGRPQISQECVVNAAAMLAGAWLQAKS